MTIKTLPFTCGTTSPEATFKIAASFAGFLNQGAVVLLKGGMGAGKTHFTRGVCSGLGLECLFEVDSPTYTLVNHYAVGPGVDHLDLYRINDSEALEEINLDGILAAPSIKLIEWPERLSGFPIAKVDFLVQFEIIDENQRHIDIQSTVGVPI